MCGVYVCTSDQTGVVVLSARLRHHHVGEADRCWTGAGQRCQGGRQGDLQLCKPCSTHTDTGDCVQCFISCCRRRKGTFTSCQFISQLSLHCTVQYSAFTACLSVDCHHIMLQSSSQLSILVISVVLTSCHSPVFSFDFMSV